MYLEGAPQYSLEVIEEYTAKGWWKNLTYGDILDQGAQDCPDKPAVKDERCSLTYAQLKEKTDRFATALLQLGVKKNDIFIIQLPNRHEWVVSFYALAKIGAVPLMSITRHSSVELSHFFDMTGAVGWIVPMRDKKRIFRPLIEQLQNEAKSLKYIITLDNGGEMLSGAFSMDKLIQEIAPEDIDESKLKELRPHPNDVAVLMPTGGTTGLPKIVPRTHNSWLSKNFLDADRSFPNSIHLVGTLGGHALGVRQINSTLLAQNTLIMRNDISATEILETIQQERVNTVGLVPTQIDRLIAEFYKYDTSSLKRILSGAGAISDDLKAKLIEFLKDKPFSFVAEMGSSEGMGSSSAPGDPLEQVLTTVGNVLTPGDHNKIVDANGNELPPNTEGELVAKGPGIFAGYYKAPETNQELFTPDGYFRTGDMAVIDEKGIMTITGRIKDIIRRGSETIMPGEIENILYRHPNIDKVSVVGMPDPMMGERICAYVVPKPGKHLTFEEMIDFVKSQGASVLLLPERLEIISELPLTEVGKVDKIALSKDIEEKLIKEGVLKG